MTLSNRPPKASQTQRRISINPFAAVLQDGDNDATPELVENVQPSLPVQNSGTHLNEDKTEESDKDDDDDASQASQSSSNGRARPPRPSMAVMASKKNLLQQRRRRRSSARFLQLSKATKDGINAGDDEDDLGHTASTSSQNGTLQEMYQQAIRMNAENKINTTNSWNLHIIDQMDTLLSLNDNDNDSSNRRNSQAPNQMMDGSHSGPAKPPSETTSTRVNFTKASCTLDASVKIYSYRVDDVHLTSYKVLANLNRTQNSKSDKSTSHHSNDDHPNADDDDDEDEARNGKNQRKESNKVSSGSTLESNMANINLNKLDSAYDIDPLFHKMSKTFDEGGAKGLLLANLGVSESSCRIIFDSSANDVEGVENLNSRPDDGQHPSHRIAEGMMDITSLTEKLKSLLSEYCDEDEWNFDKSHSNTNSVRTIPLVPQLSALRTEHEKLVELGCCGPDAATALASTIGPKTPAGKVRKYHADPEQEQDADYSIHKEAIERSHRKLNFTSEDDDVIISPRNALFLNDGTDHHSKAFTPGSPTDDDYGGGGFGGYDDGVDDDEDHGFDAFIANARYSEVSLASASERQLETTSNTMLPPSAMVANFIDEISSGTTILSNNDYEYFSSQGGKSSSNEWAGAAHWKRDNGHKGNDAKSKTKGKTSKKKSSKSKKKEFKDEALVVWNPSAPPDLSDLLLPSAKRRGNGASSTLLTKAMITKYTDEENILPHDIGFQHDGSQKSSLYHLTKLFLCPQVSILQPLNPNQNTICSGKAAVEPKKMVEFNLPSNTDWDDDNDDGPAFDFGGGEDNDDDDEFVVPLLENVRKVDKVRVGYATVAKKVDVKRLKRDLWNELESHFFTISSDDNNDFGIDMSDNDLSYTPDSGKIDIVSKPNEPAVEPAVVSFQETVRILGQEQSQTDITLPFYFICILHLANEKGLRLEQVGVDDVENAEAGQRFLSDFCIYRDELFTNDTY